MGRINRIMTTAEDIANDRSADAFISRFGVLANSIFTGVILVESVPIFYFLGNY